MIATRFFEIQVGLTLRSLGVPHQRPNPCLRAMRSAGSLKRSAFESRPLRNLVGNAIAASSLANGVWQLSSRGYCKTS